MRACVDYARRTCGTGPAADRPLLSGDVYRFRPPSRSEQLPRASGLGGYRCVMACARYARALAEARAGDPPQHQRAPGVAKLPPRECKDDSRTDAVDSASILNREW